MNKEKSHIYVSRNVHPNMANELSRVSGFALASDLGKCLGIPLHQSRVNRESCQFLEDKIQNCLSKWRAKSLSLAGRITLTKSVLNTIPVYYMQTNFLPSSTCEEIDKISRDFIWGFSDEGKGSHLIAWDRICRPKNEGGLGIRKARLMNYSLLMKIGWGLINKKDSLWACTLRSKYGSGMDGIPKIGRRNNNSNLWLGICKIWEKVKQTQSQILDRLLA